MQTIWLIAFICYSKLLSESQWIPSVYSIYVLFQYGISYLFILYFKLPSAHNDQIKHSYHTWIVRVTLAGILHCHPLPVCVTFSIHHAVLDYNTHANTHTLWYSLSKEFLKSQIRVNHGQAAFLAGYHKRLDINETHTVYTVIISILSARRLLLRNIIFFKKSRLAVKSFKFSVKRVSRNRELECHFSLILLLPYYT